MVEVLHAGDKWLGGQHVIPRKLRQSLPKTAARASDAQSMPFIKQLEQARAQVQAANADPWRIRLERIRGKVGDDGIERVSTQAVFDFLEVPQRSRTAGACRRLANLMRELGWSPIKARGMTQSGFRDQVRGYARDKTGESVF
jgi:hypothetical protein